MSMYRPLWSDVLMKSNGSKPHGFMNGVSPFEHKI